MHVRKELIWDYEVPTDPEEDESFLALYVGRVLDRGTAQDVRDLGLPLIRRFLDVAPARREVLDFWRWWLDRSEGRHGDPDGSTEEVPAAGRGGRAPSI